ncbi:MAG: beta-hydroxyacyl-ACP dehydratase [Thermoguttaceae bacterium]|nr:beta-hydroxyacyl-ACP dehydratase [Thermoguttaceae bacterium]
MNWYWIDRYEEFVSGKRARSVKVITRAEEHLQDHYPYHPVMPMSLMIEGLAQTAGLLIHEAKNFEKKVILGKVPKLKLTTTEQVPGDVLYYDVEVDYIHDEGSMVSVSVMKNNKQIGTGTLVFAHLGEGFESKELYGPEDLQDLIRGFGVYDVGVDADGNPLVDPRMPKK